MLVTDEKGLTERIDTLASKLDTLNNNLTTISKNLIKLGNIIHEGSENIRFALLCVSASGYFDALENAKTPSASLMRLMKFLGLSPKTNSNNKTEDKE